MKTLAALVLAMMANSAHGEEFMSIQPIRNPGKPHNAAWMPLASLFLPGFGQYFEKQWVSGATFTTVAASGIGLAAAAAAEISNSELNDADLQEQSDLQRQYTYGMQLYQFSGEMSAYHTFRTAVLTRQPHGDYGFIKNKEDTLDVMLSPFQLEHSIRPTTFIPLLVLATIGIAGLDSGDYMDFGDSAFTAGVSYNAGVGEEALFRGYFMPVLRENLDSYWWANSIQAVVFGAAHLSSYNSFPLAQGLMGFYLGWLTHRNGYSIRQSAFLHTWWDVMAIGFQIAHENGKKVNAKTYPLLNFTF